MARVLADPHLLKSEAIGGYDFPQIVFVGELRLSQTLSVGKQLRISCAHLQVTSKHSLSLPNHDF